MTHPCKHCLRRAAQRASAATFLGALLRHGGGLGPRHALTIHRLLATARRELSDALGTLGPGEHDAPLAQGRWLGQQFARWRDEVVSTPHGNAVLRRGWRTKHGYTWFVELFHTDKDLAG